MMSWSKLGPSECLLSFGLFQVIECGIFGEGSQILTNQTRGNSVLSKKYRVLWFFINPITFFILISLHSIYTTVHFSNLKAMPYHQIAIPLGTLSMCGALTFCELGTMFKRSGGEYQYIKAAWVNILINLFLLFFTILFYRNFFLCLITNSSFFSSICS